VSATVSKVRALAPKAVKFVTVGGSGLLVNSLVLWLTHELVPLMVASALATEAAIIYCYVGHELWTFRRGNGVQLSWKRFRNYNGLTLVGLVITAVTLQILYSTTSLHLLVANLFAIATATAWNFTMSHNWAFKAST
jgi:dolichol-phosphate mannosyltransferase